jgi:predicted PurR-regulated permease PerM
VLAIVLIVLGAVACLVLFVLGIVAPGSSRQAQRVINEGLETLQGEAARAPGRLAKWLAKPFGKSEKATNKSARAGRKTRSKLPF